MKKYFLLFFFTFFTVLPTVFAANLKPAHDTTMVAGKQYARGFLHTFFFGRHYRKVWNEPVKVPFLNLQTEAGGLKPLVRGGTYQTKNLRMVNPQGKEYVLRSIDKDPSQTLSPGKRKSFIGSLMRDQTSVIHPYGAFIIPPLADAAGILHTNPKLFVVPNDPALGEFRAEFANMLVMLEDRPEGDQENSEDFGFSKDVESSKKTFHKLVLDNKNRVDARAFLRSRLFDMWIGDWSRREDQWRWASYKTADGGLKFKGIPRDRDHAFFKFNDGLITWLVSLKVNTLQSFGPKIKHLKGLNRAAAPMDRSILVFLTKEDFIQVADSLKMQLTNNVIENALKAWPANIYNLTGKDFEMKLKKRRDQLPAIAAKYYSLLAKKVEIPGSDASEIFRITGQQNNLQVEIIRPGKKGNPEMLIAKRTFKKSETKQLKIYGLANEDRFEILGDGNPIKRVFIYDGEGEDTVIFNASKKRIIKIMNANDGNGIPETRKLKVIKYQPKATEYDGNGWLLRHRLYKY